MKQSSKLEKVLLTKVDSNSFKISRLPHSTLLPIHMETQICSGELHYPPTWAKDQLFPSVPLPPTLNPKMKAPFLPSSIDN